MNRCGKCEFDGYNHDCEELGIDNNICVAPYHINYCPYQIKYTNADKIREMGNEELARILFSLPYDEISKTKTIPHLGTDLLDVVKWLESEVE